MPDSFRLRALKNLTTLLEGITPANGYQNDMPGKVFRGRTVFGEDDPVPLLSVLEPPVPLETFLARGDNTGAAGAWDLLIQGFVPDDKDNPTDPAHALMGEVKRRLVGEKKRDRGKDILGLGHGTAERAGTGNCVMDMRIGQGSVRPADEVSGYANFWLILTLELAENLEDPYA